MDRALPPDRENSWLPAVVPASARRFRVEGKGIAATLAEAGGELVDEQPDVEIGSASWLRGAAPTVVVPRALRLPEGGTRIGRAVRRLSSSIGVRARAAGDRIRVRRLGYRRSRIVVWETQSVLLLEGVPSRGRGLTIIEKLPVGALVLGHRSTPEPTVLDAALAAAGIARRDLAGRPPTVRAGVLVTFARDTVLRTAIGRGAADIEWQREVHAALRAADPGPVVADRVPWVLADGRTGLARWSLERRIPGSPVDIKLTPPLLEDSVEFLAALFTTTDNGPRTASLQERAEQVATAATPEGAVVARELARRIESALRDVPLGFGHGDYWAGNLLARDGRLAGVVDWEGAGTGRLPVIDLLHLLLSSEALRSRRPHGRVVVEYLERIGDDELVASYCERLGLELRPEQLRMLAAAYWLDYTGDQLARSIDPETRPEWVRENVHAALASFETPLAQPPRRARPRVVLGVRPETHRDALVLCYHALSESWPSSLAVTPTNFREQIELLLERGYRAATFSETVPKPPFEKTVAITFDDSYRSVLELAFPILSEHGLVATVFVPTAHAGKVGPMTWPGIETWRDGPHESELQPMSWQELRTLAAAGWEIGSHTVTHPYLTKLDDASLHAELRDSRERCELELGRECRSLAYPYGDFDHRVIAAAGVAGYRAAATLPRRFEVGNPLAWSRVGVYRTDGRIAYRLKISASVRRLRAHAPSRPRDASGAAAGELS
jgi:peptidoglycan/xylan/chitin deacetylase (PgdA/CDA1 family)/aminoglycoside phosphotransferase (APT) family kinase protein